MQCFYPTKTVCGILLFLNHPTPPQLQYEMHPGCWVGSVHFNMAEGTSTTGSKKAVPDTVVELVDVPIYTFGCQSGLRSSHKIRGDPVLEGVAGFLGQLLQTSNAETQEMFATISPDRFGGWTPRERPSKQLLTFISSRMKTLKTKPAVREDENPKVPSRLVDTRRIWRPRGMRGNSLSSTMLEMWTKVRLLQTAKEKLSHLWKFQSRVSLNYPLSNDGIDDKYAGRVSKLYLLCEWILLWMSKNHTNKSQIYLTSSIALVGNVDTLENTVNSIPIENLFFHDHGKVDRL